MREKIFESGFSPRGGRLLSGGDFRRKSLKKVDVRGTSDGRIIGSHGRFNIIETKVRGKPALRYVSR